MSPARNTIIHSDCIDVMQTAFCARFPASLAIIHSDCIDVMQTLPERSVDFILTDPPYLAAYKSRGNKTILADNNTAWLTRSFAQMYRVLEADSCAISFYGWPKTDLFFEAWKWAGFRIGGQIVFRKGYASKTAFLQYRHESAYLLIKGNPWFPAAPLPDIMDWTYAGNKLHPTQKSIHILKPLIKRSGFGEAFVKGRENCALN